MHRFGTFKTRILAMSLYNIEMLKALFSTAFSQKSKLNPLQNTLGLLEIVTKTASPFEVSTSSRI
jgi:hypothetical protein